MELLLRVVKARSQISFWAIGVVKFRGSLQCSGIKSDISGAHRPLHFAVLGRKCFYRGIGSCGANLDVYTDLYNAKFSTKI